MRKIHYILTFLFVLSYSYGSAQTAIDLNGTNQYLQANLSTSLNQFTIDMDIYPKGGDNTFDRVFSMNSPDYFDIAVDALGDVRFISTILGVWGWTPATTIPRNTYSHLAFVYQSGQIRVLRNGTQVSTIACGSSTLNITEFTLGTTTDLFVQNANVRIDNFRFWNIAKTNADILSNYQDCLTGSEPNLMVLYDFNEGTGTVANDLAPLQGTNTGNLINNPLWMTGSGCLVAILHLLLVR